MLANKFFPRKVGELWCKSFYIYIYIPIGSDYSCTPIGFLFVVICSSDFRLWGEYYFVMHIAFYFMFLNKIHGIGNLELLD